jgi:hypothetical protein
MTGRNLDLNAALARQLRADSRCSTAAFSGHPAGAVDERDRRRAMIG